MKYALGNMLNGYGVRALDPDAKAYIDAVVAAGATVTTAQRNAINTFVKTGKTNGWYSSLKRLYLPIWGVESPNEIDMIGRTSGSFFGGMTHASGYVQGDGATGYFAPPAGSEYGNLGLSNSSASIFYLALDETATLNALHGLAGSGTQRFSIGVPSTLANMFLHPDSGSPTVVQFTGQRSGIFVGSSIATNSRTLLRTTSSGFTRNSNTGTSTTEPPNIIPFFMARNNNGTAALYADSKFGAFGYGLGLNSSQDEPFSIALKNLWESATGLTLEGAEYIAALKSAGATVTSTQESAIHTFIKTGKTDGWWSSLKRLYLPIWNIEAPNAIDMVTRTSGTFVGTVNRAAGYVSSDGSTGYFLLDQAPASLGLTTSSGSVYCLLTGDAAINGNSWIGGAQDSSNSTRIAIQPGGTNIRNFRLCSAVGVAYSETDSRSILITSRTTTTTVSSYKRTSSGFSTTLNEVSSLVGDVGTVRPMAFMANNNNGTFAAFSLSTMRFGSYGMGTGMTSSQAENFSAKLKTLWETCTGLSLP